MEDTNKTKDRRNEGKYRRRILGKSRDYENRKGGRYKRKLERKEGTYLLLHIFQGRIPFMGHNAACARCLNGGGGDAGCRA